MSEGMDRNNNDGLMEKYFSSYGSKTSSYTGNIFSMSNSATVSLNNNFYSHNSMEAGLNPRQTFWIKKRRLRREALDSIMKNTSNNYIYESRHKHAMKRLRASSGRFLTKEEINHMKKFEKNEYKEDN